MEYDLIINGENPFNEKIHYLKIRYLCYLGNKSKI